MPGCASTPPIYYGIAEVGGDLLVLWALPGWQLRGGGWEGEGSEWEQACGSTHKGTRLALEILRRGALCSRARATETRAQRPSAGKAGRERTRQRTGCAPLAQEEAGMRVLDAARSPYRLCTGCRASTLQVSIGEGASGCAPDTIASRGTWRWDQHRLAWDAPLPFQAPNPAGDREAGERWANLKGRGGRPGDFPHPAPFLAASEQK